MRDDINLEGMENDKNAREDDIKGSKISLCLPDVLSSSLMDSSVSLNWKQQNSKESWHAPWLATFGRR